MEESREDLTLLQKILPPRLEDAGLEDCALPPHSIQQAFLKAASAVGCVSDPAPQEPPPSDVLVGIEPESRPVGSSAARKDGALADDSGDVVVACERNEDDNVKKDDVVVVGADGESGSCVDVLKKLDVKEEGNESKNEDQGEQSASISSLEMAPIDQGAVIVIMGVSGAGKTTIGRLLAEAENCGFLDADDFHPNSNKEKMKAGIPLSEEDRMPWLQVLCKALKERITTRKFTVLACSALKKKYRDILRFSDSNYIPGRHDSSVMFVLLEVPVEVLADRLNSRLENGEHFMPSSLLHSQLKLLEIDASEGILKVDATQNPIVIVETIQDWLKQRIERKVSKIC